MQRRIQLRDLRNYMDKFLQHFDKLELGDKVVLSKEFPETYIEVTKRPSVAGTSALTYSLIVEDYLGIPIEVKINLELGYSDIYVKAENILPDYYPFFIDPFGNYMQVKTLSTIDKNKIKEKLRESLERI
jgi:hypothetical protein